MPLSPEFVQFLAEGDITVDDYKSLSTAEKISAVAQFRSCGIVPMKNHFSTSREGEVPSKETSIIFDTMNLP